MASRSIARTVAATRAPRAPVATPALRAAVAGSPATASPARLLQDDLSARLSAAADQSPAAGHWSSRRMLAFAVCASAALWGGIAAGGYLLLRP